MFRILDFPLWPKRAFLGRKNPVSRQTRNRMGKAKKESELIFGLMNAENSSSATLPG